MSWGEDGNYAICDGCRDTVFFRTDDVSISHGDGDWLHYHQVCWQTGWYTGIESKGEWPTPEGKPPANLPRRPLEPADFMVPQADSELTFDHISRPAFPLASKGDPREPGPLVEPLMQLFDEIGAMMEARHEKYGPGNIAEFGDLGILVRMGDKFARLKSGFQDFNDETVHDTLDDIIGYALIWKMWLNGDWPGSRDNGNNSRVG